jgi:hypothetical protein
LLSNPRGGFIVRELMYEEKEKDVEIEFPHL